MLDRFPRTQPARIFTANKSAWLIGSLATLLVLQCLLLVGVAREPQVTFLETGDFIDLDQLASEGNTPLFTRDEHLDVVALMVFDPDCPHSMAVLDEWGDYFEDETRPRTIILSRGAAAVVKDLIASTGWTPEHLILVPQGGTSTQLNNLTRRSPWVFLLERSGEIVFAGHGSQAHEINSQAALRGLAERRASHTFP